MSLSRLGNRGRMWSSSRAGGSENQDLDGEEELKSRPFKLFAGFSTDPEHVRELEDVLLCIRCREVPIPSHYFTCDLCDHLICGFCAYRRVESEENPVDLSIATCCSNRAAPTKGSERFLKALIQNAYWDCVNREGGGCMEPVRGFDWADHVKNCKKTEVRCYYPANCGYKCDSKKAIIDHLTTAHGGPEHGPNPNGVIYLIIPFDETAMQDRHLALMKSRGRHYLFGAEVVGAELHMWVWDMEAVPGENGSMKCFMKLKPGGDQKDGEIRYCAACLPYDVPPERVVEDGIGFIVGVRQLRKKYLWASAGENSKYWKVGVLIKAKGSPEGGVGVS